jgi:hypothetical protein
MHQLEREAAWHKVEKPVPVADIFKRIASEDNKEKNNQQEKIPRISRRSRWCRQNHPSAIYCLAMGDARVI